MNSKFNNLVVVITILIVLCVANFLAARHPVRLDLTGNEMFTISPATKKIFAGLDDVVTVQAYFTNDLPPALSAIRRDVDDLLSELKRAAGNKLQVEFVDPASSLMEEQKAAMLGIPPLQVNVINKDKQEVAKVYLGMVVMFGDRKQVIPVVQRADNLEYDIAEAMLRISSKETPSIAWWKPSDSAAETFNQIRSFMERRYTIKDIGKDNLAELDVKKMPALVLASPREMSENEMFALDQYLMNGGRLMALVDLAEIGQGLALKPIETNVVEFLKHNGIDVKEELVLDKSSAMAAFSGGVVTYHVPYAFWPEVRRGQFNNDIPMVANLESAVFPWTSPLGTDDDDDDGDSETVLASTTHFGVTLPLEGARLDPQSAGELLQSGPEKGRKDLVVLHSGRFKSYYDNEGRKPPKGTAVLMESVDGAKIFAVGSSHWIGDRLVGQFPANAALFENVLDALAMGDMLIGIRSRGFTDRPIVILSDNEMTALKYINLAIGSVLVLLIGLGVFVWRRSRRKFVVLAYS